MDLAFVRGRGACQQSGIPLIEGDSNAPHGNCESRTTALKSTPQNGDRHPIFSVELKRNGSSAANHGTLPHRDHCLNIRHIPSPGLSQLVALLLGALKHELPITDIHGNDEIFKSLPSRCWKPRADATHGDAI